MAGQKAHTKVAGQDVIIDPNSRILLTGQPYDILKARHVDPTSLDRQKRYMGHIYERKSDGNLKKTEYGFRQPTSIGNLIGQLAEFDGELVVWPVKEQKGNDYTGTEGRRR